MSYLSFCVYIHLLVFVLIKVLVIFTADFTVGRPTTAEKKFVNNFFY